MRSIASIAASIIIIAIAIAITAMPVQAQFIVNQSYFQDPFVVRDPGSGGQSGLPPPPPLPIPFNQTYEDIKRELTPPAESPTNKTKAGECNWWILCPLIDIFNKIKDSVIEFASFVGSFITAVFKLFELAGSLTLTFLKLLLLFVTNLGSVVVAIAASLASIIVIAIGFITLVAPTIIAWIPWIIAIAFLATLADAANRAYRSNSIYPLLGLFTMWYNFFRAIIGFFEKIFATVVRLAMLIGNFIAKVI